MLFNSFIFALVFLPLALAGWFLLNRRSFRAANVFLLGMSLWFYGYFNPRYLAIICSSIAVNYCFSRWILARRGTRTADAALLLAVAFNVGLIFYFKYYDFFISSVNAVFHADFALRHILLPLGISFFTFQQISYVADSRTGQTEGYGFLEYALFVAFFPQLVAGPIVLHNELIPQFRDPARRAWDWDGFSRGVMMFAVGLFKKMWIADVFGQLVDYGFANSARITGLDTLVVMLSYTFQIYFDFSGYSDMAMGLGRMFNLDIPQNFNSPYQSCSVTEFWTRWHMTLTRFLRRYVYFPLGGNRRGTARTYRNILAVFLVSGLWHGANWTFVLWGALHGAASVLERVFRKPLERLPRVVRWLYTFAFVNTAWLLFRADSIGQWASLLGRMVRPAPPELTIVIEDLTLPFRVGRRLLSMVWPGAAEPGIAGSTFLLWTAMSLTLCLRGKNTRELSYPSNFRTLAGTAAALLLCILTFSREQAFIYFNF